MDKNVYGFISLIIVIAAWFSCLWVFVQIGIPFDEPGPAMFLLVIIAFVYLLTVGSYKEKK